MSLEPQIKSIKTWINLKETDIYDPEKKIRDVKNIGHHGIGNYEFRIENNKDIFYFINLCKQAYDEKNT